MTGKVGRPCSGEWKWNSTWYPSLWRCKFFKWWGARRGPVSSALVLVGAEEDYKVGKDGRPAWWPSHSVGAERGSRKCASPLWEGDRDPEGGAWLPKASQGYGTRDRPKGQNEVDQPTAPSITLHCIRSLETSLVSIGHPWRWPLTPQLPHQWPDSTSHSPGTLMGQAWGCNC